MTGFVYLLDLDPERYVALLKVGCTISTGRRFREHRMKYPRLKVLQVWQTAELHELAEVYALNEMSSTHSLTGETFQARRTDIESIVQRIDKAVSRLGKRVCQD